ncbi:hypothetical protein BS78_05G099900 [Paspalum vaginatum]|nr:hypothetical protein BS78_05G099900 [Paspalum vaginatum]
MAVPAETDLHASSVLPLRGVVFGIFFFLQAYESDERRPAGPICLFLRHRTMLIKRPRCRACTIAHKPCLHPSRSPLSSSLGSSPPVPLACSTTHTRIFSGGSLSTNRASHTHPHNGSSHYL